MQMHLLKHKAKTITFVSKQYRFTTAGLLCSCHKKVLRFLLIIFTKQDFGQKQSVSFAFFINLHRTGF